MYVKFIGGMFLLSSATAIGFLKAEELKIRIKHLQEFKRMIMLLQGEMRFHRAELSEAFESVSKRIGEPFGRFLKEVAEQLEQRESEGFEKIWNEKSKHLLCAEGFLKEDLQLVELLGSSLGYLDLAMQTEHLNMTIYQAEEAVMQAKKQWESKGKLYQTMGVTVGTLLTLLMI